MKKLKISIVTPNYNYANYIGQTIESIINQDYDNWEHIIVDDGSTDNSVEIIERYVKEYPNKIKLIKQENRGQTPAINRGLREITGEIIGWINSDDYYSPIIFSKIIETFTKEKCEIVYGDANVIDLEGNFIYRIRNLKIDLYYGFFYGFSKVVTSNSVFWNKNLFNRVGFFDERFIINMDGEFFSRLFREAKSSKYINIPLANFRKQNISIAGKQDANWSEKVKREVKIEIENSINFLNKKKINLLTLKYISLFRRIFKRLIKNVYLKRFIESKSYEKKIKNSGLH